MHVMSDQSRRKPGPDLQRHDTFATGNPPVHVTQLSGVLDFGYARRGFTMSMTQGQAGESLTGSRRNMDPSLRLVFGSTNTKKSFVLVTAQDPDPRTQTRSAIERSQLDAPRRSRRSWLRSYVHTDEGASRSAPRRYSWTAKISWLVIGP